jgi:hypothetical protein
MRPALCSVEGVEETMKNETETTGSPDEKTRIDGDRVIHTPKGALYQGDSAEPPRGLTNEQSQNQRTGWNIAEREIREAAQGEGQATEWGDTNERQPAPGKPHKGDSDDF